ncbi:hypothetical protein HOA91_00620 [Candidatus Woesearchaeota archaeon]|jgi:hypothetical protein|nr:hypothetical protein [Candidatus Woesearchaeota archaeon]
MNENKVGEYMYEQWASFLGEEIEISNKYSKELVLENWRISRKIHGKPTAIEFDVVFEDGFKVEKIWFIDDKDLIMPLLRVIVLANSDESKYICISVQKKGKNAGYTIKTIRQRTFIKRFLAS